MIHKLPLPSDLPAVTIVGAGKLGKAVAAVWEERGGSIAKLVTSGQTWEPKGLVFEATQPEAAAENLARCIRARIPVVTGTTGWLDQLPEMLDMSQKERSTVFYSTNFSPGIHALNAIAKHAVDIFGQIPGYQPRIQEVHHVEKKDAPSGTALTLAQLMKQRGWTQDMAIESIREGEVMGLHSLVWDSEHDAVVLQHEAKSRIGFAKGAVWALCWTWQRHAQAEFGLYTMTDLFET